MRVTKCDVCLKEVAYDDQICAGPGSLPKFAFHTKCAKPIVDFLKEKGLLEQKDRA